MKNKFSKERAIIIFFMAAIFLIVCIGIDRLFSQRQISFTGLLLCAIVVLFASIFGGFWRIEKKKIIEKFCECIETSEKIKIEKEKESELKRLRKNRLISQKSKEAWVRRKADKYNASA